MIGVFFLWLTAGVVAVDLWLTALVMVRLGYRMNLLRPLGGK